MIGINAPVYFSREFWLMFVFVYILIACVTPVWALLQPRDYLNSYLLIAMMLMAFIGIIVYRPAMNLAPFTSFRLVNEEAGKGSFFFPVIAFSFLICLEAVPEDTNAWNPDTAPQAIVTNRTGNKCCPCGKAFPARIFYGRRQGNGAGCEGIWK